MEDNGNITPVKKTIEGAVIVVGFIDNHVGALNMKRVFINKEEMIRHEVSRFATIFLTLQQVHL